MNAPRLAELWRLRAAAQLAVARANEAVARLDEEIATELGAESGPVMPRQSQRRMRGPRIPIGVEVTDLDRKRAEKAARDRGMLR